MHGTSSAVDIYNIYRVLLGQPSSTVTVNLGDTVCAICSNTCYGITSCASQVANVLNCHQNNTTINHCSCFKIGKIRAQVKIQEHAFFFCFIRS